MRLGYNTNGFSHHRLDEALAILADLGYESVAITLDHHALNPHGDELNQQIDSVREQLQRLNLHCVIETGARFLLDPWRKHQPTLLSALSDERERRLDFLRRAIAIAQALQADGVSFWSGTPLTEEPAEVLEQRLVDSCRRLSDEAAAKGVRLAFEPEPGMFIDTMDSYRRLRKKVAHPFFGLTIDVGHLHCLGEIPISDRLREWGPWLWNVHIEDMRRDVHEHLMFGEGEIEFGPVLQTLGDIGYTGGIHVELSRHGHDAVEIARRAGEFLQAIWPAEKK